MNLGCLGKNKGVKRLGVTRVLMDLFDANTIA